MTTPKPDPAEELVERLFIPAPEMPGYADDEKSPLEERRREYVGGLAEQIRAAYAEHMKAAEEMAKQTKYMLYLFDRDLTGDMLGRQVCDDASAALARWRELNPEVEG